MGNDLHVLTRKESRKKAMSIQWNIVPASERLLSTLGTWENFNVTLITFSSVKLIDVYCRNGIIQNNDNNNNKKTTNPTIPK